MTDDPWVVGLDTSKPNMARVYDFWLGGKDNFAADREIAAKLLEIDPTIPRQVQDNREFVTSVAARAAADGVAQFLDLGAGLPSHPAVHEAVRKVNPDARVAYVDIDPVVVNHAAALLAKGPGLTAARGDAADPDAVLNDPTVLKVIDPGQPLCVLMVAVLHYVEPGRASAAVRRYVELLPAGSWLVITVVHTTDPAAIGRIPLYTAATIHNHSPDDLQGWLAGTELVPPGIAERRRWMSGIGGIPRCSDPAYALCAVGIKRLLPLSCGGFRLAVSQRSTGSSGKGQEAEVTRVFLIRHGESESNAGLPSAGPGAIPLTAAGHRQAEQVARVLADVPALIVTSPYLRARQTAEPMVSRFPATACQQWPVQEFTYLGDLHGRASTSREREPYVRAYWDRADPHAVSPGAESFAGLLGRTADFLRRLSPQESGPVVVFTHAMFMQAVAWSLLTGITTPDHEQMRGFRGFADRYLIPNAGIVELRHAGNGAPALLGGSTIHLPAALAPRP